jgi:hypothetical protein
MGDGCSKPKTSIASKISGQIPRDENEDSSDIEWINEQIGKKLNIECLSGKLKDKKITDQAPRPHSGDVV